MGVWTWQLALWKGLCTFSALCVPTVTRKKWISLLFLECRSEKGHIQAEFMPSSVHSTPLSFHYMQRSTLLCNTLYCTALH